MRVCSIPGPTLSCSFLPTVEGSPPGPAPSAASQLLLDRSIVASLTIRSTRSRRRMRASRVVCCSDCTRPLSPPAVGSSGHSPFAAKQLSASRIIETEATRSVKKKKERAYPGSAHVFAAHSSRKKSMIANCMAGSGSHVTKALQGRCGCGWCVRLVRGWAVVAGWQCDVLGGVGYVAWDTGGRQSGHAAARAEVHPKEASTETSMSRATRRSSMKRAQKVIAIKTRSAIG